MREATAISAIAAAAFAFTASATCPGVDHDDTTASGWRTHSFENSATKDPLSVSLTVSEIGSGTTIEYYDGSSWSSINGPTTVSGEQIRVSDTGSARVSYIHNQCGEDIQLPDEET